MMPSLFLAHGSPMLAIEETPYTEFLDELGKRLRPRAIVIFTAHWESPVLTVSRMNATYETIYDFGGFPPELYEVKYNARGSIEVADDVVRRFAAAGIETRTDARRGLDHGSWTMLHRMSPQRTSLSCKFPSIRSSRPRSSSESAQRCADSERRISS